MSDKIITREDAAGLAASTGQVRTLLQSTKEQSERMFNEAYRSGLNAGRDAGLRAFATATAEAVQAIREEFFTLEPMLAPLVQQAVEKIIGAMPQDEVMRRAIATAMMEAGSAIHATLRVAPDDIDVMRGAVRMLASERPELASSIVAVEADASLRKGEMLLETLRGRTHFGIDYQMSRLRYAMETAAQ